MVDVMDNRVRSLYVNTQNLEGIMFPNQSVQYASHLRHNELIEDYLKKIFSTQLVYHDHSKFKLEDDVANQFTMICVKLLLTDKDRTGMFLLHERNGKVSIPGGHVDRIDVDYVREDLGLKDAPLRILQEALARELREEIFGESRARQMILDEREMYNKGLYETAIRPLRTIESTIYSKFKLEGPIHPVNDLYYMYKAVGLEELRALTFYYVLEVDLKTPYVISGVSEPPSGFIWIQKDNVRRVSNPNTSMDMLMDMLGCPVGPPSKDLRFNEVYRHILDIIFNTTELF